MSLPTFQSILWFCGSNINPVQPSPSILPLLLPLLGPPPASFCTIALVCFGILVKKGKRTADGKWGCSSSPVPGPAWSRKPVQEIQPWFCFLPPLGELRILSNNKSTKLLHCSKKPCKNIKPVFAQSKSTRRLPAKFKDSRIKSVRIKWELQHQSQAKKEHSMSSWDCLLCNMLSTFFIPFAWISFSFELQTTCTFRPKPIPTKISGCFLTNYNAD